MNADEFYKSTIGKQFDLDGVPVEQPYQCADYFKEACRVTLGYHWSCGGDGYVDNWWYNRTDSMRNVFDFVTDYHQLQNGDFVIWANASRGKTPYNMSHIAMYYNGNMVGQNQPYTYVNSVQVDDSIWSQMLGAFRFKKWHVDDHKAYNSLEQINAIGTEKSTRKIATSFHVYKKNGASVKMEMLDSTFNDSHVKAIQIQLTNDTDLSLSYKGEPDWLCSMHNDWFEQNGYEEVAAVNAGYFEMETGKPVGAVLTDWSGKWSKFNGEECVPARNNGYPTLAWDGWNMTVFDKNADEIILKNYEWLCGVGQSLVLNGEVDNSVGSENGRFMQKNCATAIGFNHKTRVLTFAINYGSGLDTQERSNLMKNLGCDTAVQLDGGGSAQLEWLQSEISEFETNEIVAKLEKVIRSLQNVVEEIRKEHEI